jgi:hypothetical protein
MALDEKAQQVWVRCFDEALQRIRCTGATTNPPADTAFQWQHVLNEAFDPVENRLRID